MRLDLMMLAFEDEPELAELQDELLPKALYLLREDRLEEIGQLLDRLLDELDEHDSKKSAPLHDAKQNEHSD